MTLYLKYRPKNLDELDLESVRESLVNIIKSKNIPHAFLFAGPKGTGKTSAARIIAKIVNCVRNEKGMKEPCNICEQCTTISNSNNIDVIELDAASHRGIDDVRMLRDAVKLAPAKARKKVYIIDEAHMLTTEASNALLKILEEPPKHVIFILATTNPEKLIVTIRSRTTLIRFNKAQNSEIARSLRRIAKGEKIKMDERILELIANASDGSFRDATKLLEQIIAENIQLKTQVINEYLSKKTGKNIEKLLIYLRNKNDTKAIDLIEGDFKKGLDAQGYLDSMISRLKDSLLAKIGLGEDAMQDWLKEELVYLIELLIKAKESIPNSTIEHLPIELAVIKWCLRAKVLRGNGSRLDNNQSKSTERSTAENRESAKKVVKKSESNEDGVNGKISDFQWKMILDEVKPINTSIEALLRSAKPVSFDGEILTLGVFYKFHKERLEENRNRQLLEGVVQKVLEIPARVVCTLTKPPERKVSDKVELAEGEDEDIVKVAKDIFGG